MSTQTPQMIPDIQALVLAAGKGTRMKSREPKVLQTLLGLPLLWYVFQALEQILPLERIWTVLGYQQERVQAAFPDQTGRFLLQSEQLGTGHALQCALPTLLEQGSRWCLIVNGDVPLIRAEDLARFVREIMNRQAILGFLTLELDDPAGYGRVLRDSGSSGIRGIIEEKDLGAHPELASIREVNSGMYCVDMLRIGPYLEGLTNHNQQQEYYITQLVDLCVQGREQVVAINSGGDGTFLGINSPRELSVCEEILRSRIVSDFFEQGVIVHNPDQVRIAPTVSIDPGVEITGPVEVYGRSWLKAGSRLDSHLWIKDSQIGPGAWIRNFSHLEEVIVGQECQVGPYARLRPGSEMGRKARAGNFVEIKKAFLDAGCKVNHLSYIGDATLGQDVNVGAGTITCNYDGVNKHKTCIGNQAFIGSNSALVAPVTIGEKSLIGAGTVVTKNVPDGSLAVTRVKQRLIDRKKK